jgi:chromosome segregation ATPase
MSDRPRDQYLDLPEGDPLSTEHLDEKVQQAAAQEQDLKRRLEAIERQKRELEEMSRRQDALNTGKAEMLDKMTRALVVLEREMFDASKRVETLQTIQESFRAHLDVLDSLNPKSWEGLDISKELTRALGAVDDARSEYGKCYPKITAQPALNASASSEGNDGYVSDYSVNDGKDFISWMKIGFAFSLPLLVLGLIALIVIASRIK